MLLFKQFAKLVLKEGASLLRNQKMWLPEAEGTAMLWKNRQVTRDLDLSDGCRYEIRMRLTSELSEAKAALLSVEYLDEARQTIGWEAKDFNFSSRWGFFRYLPASPEGSVFRLAVDPPAGAAVIRVFLIGWVTKGSVLVSDLSVREIGMKLEEQRKTLFAVIEDLDGSRPLTVWYQGRLGDTRPPPVEGVGLFFCDEAENGGSADVRCFNVDLFADSYQQIAAAVDSDVPRKLIVDQPGFYSVLSANCFAAKGWSFEFRGSGANTKSRYLATLADTRSGAGATSAV